MHVSFLDRVIKYRVRPFYFVLAVLLYNLWRLTVLMLKTSVSTEIVDFSLYLTAGKSVDYVQNISGL